MAAIPIFNAHRRARRNPSFFRDRPNILEVFNDAEILSRYRLNRDSIEWLEELLFHDLASTTNRGKPVTPQLQILVGLRYLAKGEFFSEVGDLHGLSKSTVSIRFEPFLDAVNSRLDNIRFPTSRQELNRIKHVFFQKAGIPGVVGAVDGTLIPIIGPVEQEEAYVCRKGYHAINVQAVVDHKMRFTDVVAKWPGSQHDASIFNHCGLKDYLEANNIGHLLGDSGYPLRRYLITPKLNTHTPAEIQFNVAHTQTRVLVERAFGVLKSRFRCLHRSGGCLPFKPGKCCKVAMACMRLHNLCVDKNIPLPDHCLANVEGNNDIVDQQNVGSGHQAREAIIALF